MRLAEYTLRDPSASVLYTVVRDHFETFRAESAPLRDGDELLRFVEDEFRAFLLAGAGGYEVPTGDQALQVFVDAIARKDPRAQRLWFDVTTVVLPMTPAELAALIAQRIRQLGVQRVLLGSDSPTEESFAPKAAWAAFRPLPLTEAEFQTIAGNVPPYMR